MADYDMQCFAGQDVVIVKNGQRICGSGAALANAPLVQNKSYFEVKVQQAGEKQCSCLYPLIFVPLNRLTDATHAELFCVPCVADFTSVRCTLPLVDASLVGTSMLLC